MPTSPLTRIRLARTVALAVVMGIGIFNLYQAAANWTLSDASAYWNAALRIREGLPLYPMVTSVDASEVYRYAPWFAWATVPITWLPVNLAAGLWSAVLLAASGVAMVPLVRARAWMLVALFAPILVGISAVGNVQAILVAGLVWGAERRSGPLWIGLSASLKIFPILFAVVYLGRREWARFAMAVGIAAFLWAPAFLYDLRGYVTDAGEAASLFAVPAAWAVALCAGALLTLGLARTRFGWLAGAVNVVVSLPRLFLYDVTFLMVGVVPGERPSQVR